MTAMSNVLETCVKFCSAVRFAEDVDLVSSFQIAREGGDGAEEEGSFGNGLSCRER
jgi:hypothetical protein